MFELKRLAPEAVTRAVQKAEHYRLLNEANEAESICLDVLAVEPENQQAMIVLILALTDQFVERASMKEAQDCLARLHSDYDRAYYGGIICERFAKAQLAQRGSALSGYHWLSEAMNRYEEAERLRPPGNDDALLRWNTCARILQRSPQLVAHASVAGADLLE